MHANCSEDKCENTCFYFVPGKRWLETLLRCPKEQFLEEQT